MSDRKEVLIIGGGIAGLTLALCLHKLKVPFRVFEATPELKQLGVGLNLLPHAMRSLAELGLEQKLVSKGIQTRELCFYARNGQCVYQEPRGKYAAYEWPQVSIHRGDLHVILAEEVARRSGRDALLLSHQCLRVEQDGDSVTAYFRDPATGADLRPVRGAAAISCDGVHSVTRVQMHPNEAVPRYEGTTQYRGTTRWKPYLSGATMFYLGTIELGKLIMYPIRNNIDDEGRQLINWVVEISRPPEKLLRDWNRKSRAEEFVDSFADCSFDWLHIPAVLRGADEIYEYPMVDQDPLPFWSQGRITLLGDAAHPMMPRGSNGAAQAIIDATCLSRLLASCTDPVAALKAYETERLGATSKVVLANRDIAPDAILRTVEERAAGRSYKHINEIISPEEVAVWQARYRKVAGFAVEDLAKTQ
jgi:5-methylphenazine-1-carboxylate 1-monooxygenase